MNKIFNALKIEFVSTLHPQNDSKRKLHTV